MHLSSILVYNNIFVSLVKKELKGRYTTYWLGMGWILVLPLLMALLVDFVFTQIIKTGIPHVSLFVLCGLIPWMFFSRAVSDAAASFFQAKSLLHQFTIPKCLVPCAGVIAQGVHFLLSLGIIIPWYVYAVKHIYGALLLLPLVCVLFIFFTCAVSLLIAIGMVFFRDIEAILGMVFMCWFWLTPVFYSRAMVPEQYRFLFIYNPLALFIESFRDILFFMHYPSREVWMGMISWTIGLLGVALWSWKRTDHMILKKL